MREYWLDPPEYHEPECPVCGEECEIIYKQDGKVIGCDQCIDSEDAYDWYEEKLADDEATRADMAYDYIKDMRFENQCQY